MFLGRLRGGGEVRWAKKKTKTGLREGCQVGTRGRCGKTKHRVMERGSHGAWEHVSFPYRAWHEVQRWDRRKQGEKKRKKRKKWSVLGSNEGCNW